MHRPPPTLRAAACLAGSVLLLLGAAASLRAADPPKLTIVMEGIVGDMENSARANLELQQYVDRDISSAQARRLVELGREEIRRGLEPFGFYDARVEGQLTGEAGRLRATFKVTPGEQVKVRDARVQVTGAAETFPDVRTALREFQPAVGQPLNHAQYEGSKARVITLLQGAGFFDSQLERHKVEVTREAASADIDLAWKSGERYRFGDVTFTDAQFKREFLRRYLPWSPDDYYSTEQLLVLQQRLIDADYFATVSAQPQLDARADGHVPVEVLLVPAKRTIYTAHAYMSTDSGPGAAVGMERRWINGEGHKVGGQIEYSTRLQAVTAFYRIPKPGRISRSYNFATGYRDEETDSTRSRLARLSATEAVDDWHGFARTLGLNYLNGDFVVADEQNASSLLYAEGTLTRKRADNLMFPSRGLSIVYTARFAAENPLSDTSLAQLRADAKWVRPLGGRSRLIVRATLGALETGDFDALPPELRFFAGGDRSVRGFDYQEIGELNANRKVIGGRYLTVASGEVEHYFLEQWGAAVFVDAGDAYNSSLNANGGAGLGVRWKSPVGIVRVDFAVPVSTDLPDRGLRFHIMIGPDL